MKDKIRGNKPQMIYTKDELDCVPKDIQKKWFEWWSKNSKDIYNNTIYKSLNLIYGTKGDNN